MITKKALMRDLDEACVWVYACMKQNQKLKERNEQLCQENIALMHEVRYLSDRIDCAISYCESKKRKENAFPACPAWLKEVMAE